MINEFEVGDEIQFKGSTEEWIDAEIIYKGVFHKSSWCITGNLLTENVFVTSVLTTAAFSWMEFASNFYSNRWFFSDEQFL